MKSIAAILFALVFVCICVSADAVTIAKDGAAQAVIVVAENAIPAERYAAEELASFLGQVTGGSFQVVKQPKAGMSSLFVGPGAARMVDSTFSTDGLEEDGIVIKTVGKELILAGGAPRGTLYAVYTFLEGCVGCHWWSSAASTVPHKPTLEISNLDVRYVPRFEYREISYVDAVGADYSVRNKLNGTNHKLIIDDGQDNARMDLKRGGRKYSFHKSARWSGHTFYTLMPPEVYFDEHPDWYAWAPDSAAVPDRGDYGKIVDGLPFAEGPGRRPKSVEECKSQLRSLCLTNEDVQKEIQRNSKLAIFQSPIATWFSISQIDGMNPCRCEKCIAVAREEEAYSGTLIRFLNAVAEPLAKFTSMPIHTFAYHYTHKPPKHVKPASNIIINLVGEYTTCRLLTDTCNKEYVDDLLGWLNIANRVYVYEYAPNFQCPLVLHPNFRVLAPNFKYYTDHGVRGINFEAYGWPGTEMAELRAWLTAKLMWDPNQDTTKLIAQFCDGYYGPAGKEMLAYVNTVQDATQAYKGNLNYSTAWNDDFFTSFDFLNNCYKHLQEAEVAANDDPEFLGRVQVAKLPITYIFLMRWDEMREKAKSAGATWLLPESAQDAVLAFMRIVKERRIGKEMFTSRAVSFPPGLQSLVDAQLKDW